MPDDMTDTAPREHAWHKEPGIDRDTFSADDVIESWEVLYVGPLCAIHGRLVRACLEVTYYTVQVPDDEGGIDEDDPYGFGVNEMDHFYYRPVNRVTGDVDFGAGPLEWGEDYDYPDGPDVRVFPTYEEAVAVATGAAKDDESWKMGAVEHTPETI